MSIWMNNGDWECQSLGRIFCSVVASTVLKKVLPSTTSAVDDITFFMMDDRPRISPLKGNGGV